MLEDYRKQEGVRLNVNWEGWLLSVGIDSDGDAYGLHDQNYIHNGKKTYQSSRFKGAGSHSWRGRCSSRTHWDGV